MSTRLETVLQRQRRDRRRDSLFAVAVSTAVVTSVVSLSQLLQ